MPSASAAATPQHARDPPGRPGQHLGAVLGDRRGRREQQVGARRRERGREPLAQRRRPAGRPPCGPPRPTPAGRAACGSPSRRRRPCPGSRMPGTSSTAAASAGSAPSSSSTATGSASRSSRRRTRATAGPRSRGSASRSVAVTCVGGPRVSGSCSAHRRRRRAGAAACARSRRRPSVSTPATARAAKNASRPSASNGGRNGSRSTSVPATAGVRPAPSRLGAQRRRRHPVDGADGVVELPHAGEPRRERDVRHAQRRRLDQQPGGVRAVGAGERERARAELGASAPGSRCRSE